VASGALLFLKQLGAFGHVAIGGADGGGRERDDGEQRGGKTRLTVHGRFHPADTILLMSLP
jgi:hypothetical protein